MRRRTRPRTLPIGTISEGTLRPEDLIPALLYALDRLHLSKAERAMLTAIRAESQAEDYSDGTGAAEALDELSQIAEAHVPDYCTYGSTGGDGACFGVWPMIDAFDDQVYRSHALPGEPSTPVPGFTRATWKHEYTDQPYWLYVNDHGNATLYRKAGRRWIEVWSVV